MPETSLLFQGMDPAERDQVLHTLRAEERVFPKGAVLLHAGDLAPALGLVLSGSVTIESNDAWGNRTVLSHVGPGQSFAEVYALLPGEPLLVDVSANEESRILFLHLDLLRAPTGTAPVWQQKLTMNLLQISARKNLALSGRSFHTSPKTVRGRVMAYLNSVRLQQGSARLEIPFDRQQLADYLNLDRSALSKELGKMQREGLLLVKKNHFTILRPEE